MALTQNELARIHSHKLATENRKYYSDDGKVYIGLANGRLEVLQKAADTNTSTIPELNVTNVQQALETLAENVSTLNNANFATISYVDSEVEHAKCFAITMSLIL